MGNENIGDWLQILFLAVMGIGSLLSVKKKKKRPRKIPNQPDWDIIVEETEPVITPPVPSVPPVKTRTPIQVTERKQYKPPMPAKAETTSFAEEENGAAAIELKNAADLRKAVIYAEILNRKY
ncbi:hypothetical protein [Parabacteroides sp. AM08-6]|uniref:hypothetical protein n=1 Tax=Parabacteroides sp. AM08-6 TaxID=2292053 RepID=UPI000EFE2326|nr:hypothetical protein [Parabacteroides sp. AM08-6]RHJ78529.1 hypothetical protein DW103_14685 [Parabacteroides sp. AM08-6]